MRLVSILHKRDKKIAKWFIENKITWHEKRQQGYLEESWIGKIGQN